jgi:hypothetical protein
LESCFKVLREHRSLLLSEGGPHANASASPIFIRFIAPSSQLFTQRLSNQGSHHLSCLAANSPILSELAFDFLSVSTKVATRVGKSLLLSGQLLHLHSTFIMPSNSGAQNRHGARRSPGRGCHHDHDALNALAANIGTQHSGAQAEGSPSTGLPSHRGSGDPSQGIGIGASAHTQTVEDIGQDQHAGDVLDIMHPGRHNELFVPTSMAEHICPQYIDPSIIMSPSMEATHTGNYDPRFRAAVPHTWCAQSIAYTGHSGAGVQPTINDFAQPNVDSNVSEQMNDRIFMSNILSRSDIAAMVAPGNEVSAPSWASRSDVSNRFSTSYSGISDASSSRYAYNAAQQGESSRSLLPDLAQDLQSTWEGDPVERLDCSDEKQIRILVRRSTPGPYLGLQDPQASLMSM